MEAGLIIHENRFTYKEKGLEKIIDLGEFWERETGLVIPLGGIVIKRDIPLDVQQKFECVLRESVKFAFENRNSSINGNIVNIKEFPENLSIKNISQIRG